MIAKVISIRDLTPGVRDHWISVQSKNPTFSGPMFRPELFETIGCYYPGVQLAIISTENGDSYFPFLLDPRWAIAQPIPMCDYQGIIGMPGQRHNVPDLLKALGLVTWDFENLRGFASLDGIPDSFKRNGVQRINLEPGMEKYWQSLAEKEISFKNLQNKRKKIEKKIGPLRFEFSTKDPAVLKKIIEWKANRFNNGEAIHEWVIQSLEKLCFAPESKGFSSALSAMYAGDQLVAAHFGLICDHSFFYWFPGFAPEFSQFTPGWLLIHELIKSMRSANCQILDFGPGGESYKRSFSNEEWPILRGCFEAPSVLNFARKSQRKIMNKVRSTKWIYEGLRPLMRTARHIKNWR